MRTESSPLPPSVFSRDCPASSAATHRLSISPPDFRSLVKPIFAQEDCRLMNLRNLSSGEVAASFQRLQFAAQHMGEGFDGEFDEQKRLGDEIIAAGHG